MVFVRAPRPAVEAEGAGGGAARVDAGAWVDIAVVGLLAALLAGLLAIGRRWNEPFRAAPEVDLSLAALPAYACWSLSRGVLAYGLSLVFAVAYGTMAARSRRAERVMVPILDVLQSIPVLSFMPGLVLGLVALFPGTNTGLELACVLSIFTGQVWNMVFSYHASLKAIPAELKEVGRLVRLGFWPRLVWLELPSAMLGLVWNSMMSMAGGWFFLTVVESFHLGSASYRLPGLGSYMAAAAAAGDGVAMAAAIAVMVAMIVLVDQLVWRPLLAWAERFKHEETSAAERPTSFVYDGLRRSRLLAWAGAWLGRRLVRSDNGARRTEAAMPGEGGPRRSARRVGMAVLILVAALGAAWGSVHLARLLLVLGWADWMHIARGFGFTALRVAGAVAIGAAWAVPAGIAIGASPRLSRLLQPLIQVAASFPAPMLFPLLAPALLRLGVSGDGVAVALMLLGTQWYVLFNVVAGAAAIPHDLREAAVVCRLGARRRFVVLYLGGVFPYLVTGVVTAAGGAWNASIVAEAVQYDGGVIAVDGIGSIIAAAFGAGNDSMLAAATLWLSVALVLVNRFVWRRLYRVADERFAMNR